GMGMRLQDVVLRDDIRPYQRYDLEDLLPVSSLELPSPPAVFSATLSSTTSTKKWIIPIVAVGVIVILTVATVAAIVYRDRNNGGNSRRQVGSHNAKKLGGDRLHEGGYDRTPW
ncbi:hypothetical protein Agub_g10750, partial [Astrephomene gubernaculifera]